MMTVRPRTTPNKKNELYFARSDLFRAPIRLTKICNASVLQNTQNLISRCCFPEWSLGAAWLIVLIAAGANPGFVAWSSQEYFYSPLVRMLVHLRSLARNLLGFPSNSPILGGAREALWELSVLPKNTTQYPQPGLGPRQFDPSTRALIMGCSHHEATRFAEDGKEMCQD